MRSLFAGFVASLLTIAAIAQVGGGGTIQGTVTDQSGGVLSGTTVTPINTETGVETTRKTTEAGLFVISPLQPGEYSITVKAAGFQTLTQQHIRVIALGTAGVNPK